MSIPTEMLMPIIVLTVLVLFSGYMYGKNKRDKAKRIALEERVKESEQRWEYAKRYRRLLNAIWEHRNTYGFELTERELNLRESRAELNLPEIPPNHFHWAFGNFLSTDKDRCVAAIAIQLPMNRVAVIVMDNPGTFDIQVYGDSAVDDNYEKELNDLLLNINQMETHYGVR